MPTPIGITSTPVPAAHFAGRRSLHLAWACVALVPVAFVAAFVVGEWLVLVMIVMGSLAVWLGLRTRRLGLPSGLVPALIGVAAAAFGLLTTTLPLLLSAD